ALKVVQQPDNAYEPMKRNGTLVELFRANARVLGVVESPESRERMGSSDIGNVSQVIPAIQPMVQIAPEGTPIHSRAFEEAAVRPLARDGMLASAKIMAMTACDLLANPAVVADARREFDAATAPRRERAGAALAALGTLPFAGRIQVIGTPAEEGGAGKVKLMDAGVFDGVDAAMMIHGRCGTQVWRPSLGIIKVKVEFFGQAAHASSWPW